MMNQTQAANGFGNRFLFINVRRSKHLLFGGNLDELALADLGRLLSVTVEHTRTVGRVGMTPAARERWAAVYADLSAERDGLLGTITARAEAQTVRLALLYALLDRRRPTLTFPTFRPLSPFGSMPKRALLTSSATTLAIRWRTTRCRHCGTPAPTA